MSGTNIAVYKEASQSSDSTEDYTADKAVDGNENTHMNSAFLSKTCSRTREERNPYWLLDLGARETIHKVNIAYNSFKYIFDNCFY